MARNRIPIVLALVALTSPAFSAGLLKPVDAPDDPLSIVRHEVEVTILDGFAVTTVDQSFANPGERDLEAWYTFPLPAHAALSELSLWIDGVEVVGEVVERERAKAIYEEEKAAGRETGLAEKRDYLAFDVHVSPVRAGEETRVRLTYVQPIEIDHNVGRYVYPLEEGRIDEEVQEFWTRKESVAGTFSFRARIRSSYPVDEVRTKGHDHLAHVATGAMNDWDVSIEDLDGAAALDQDIVLYWRLAEDVPARVDLRTFRTGDGDGTYLLTVTPGNDLRPIQEGIDWVVVLDVSGSMGPKIATAADAVERALGQMRPGDRYRIVTFSQRARDLDRRWRSVTPADLDESVADLHRAKTGGGTNVFAGIERALDHVEADRTSAVVLVSDGGANVGPTHHRAFLDLLARKDVRVFTFVFGQGANVPLMERLAEASGGFSMAVSNRDDLAGRLLQAKDKLGREAMHGFTVSIDGVRTHDAAPTRVPTLYHGEQYSRLGRYSGAGEATLTVEARISGEPRTWETTVVFPEYDDDAPELERLWAFERTRDMTRQIRDGETDESELRPAIVDLATEYSIVTDYTSMVVVSERRFEDLGIDRDNAARTASERTARERRAEAQVREVRADGHRPLYGNDARPHAIGGSGGGAVGPAWIALLAGLALVGGIARRFGA